MIKIPAITAFLVSATAASAAVTYTGGVLNQTFTGFDGNSAPVGWDATGFGGSGGTNGFTRLQGPSPGGINTGGTYAFDIGSGNIALGVQPIAAAFTPGTYQLEIINQTGSDITQWTTSHQTFVYNDRDRSNSLSFDYSVDGGTTYLTPANAVGISTLARDTNPTWQSLVNFSQTLTDVIPAGGSVILRWTGDDVSGSGTRDEFAVDDVQFEAIVVPEPSVGLLTILAGLALLNRRSRS